MMTKATPKHPACKGPSKKGAWAGVVIIVAAVIAAMMVAAKAISDFRMATADYPICADTAKGVKVTLAKPEVEVKLNPRCRSGWVELPNGGPKYYARVSTPAELEILFWGEREPLLVEKPESLWLGWTKKQVFRLRGEGTATIVLEPLVAPPATTPTAPPPAPLRVGSGRRV